MARQLIVSRSNGMSYLELREASGAEAQPIIKVNELAEAGMIAVLSQQNPGLETFEESEYVTPGGWHWVMRKGSQGWYPYMPGGLGQSDWFPSREAAEREANAASG